MGFMILQFQKHDHAPGFGHFAPISTPVQFERVWKNSEGRYNSTLFSGKWFEPRSISSLSSVIVRVSVV